MKTTAGQALRFAACARAPMRQARCAGTALTSAPLRARVAARRRGDLAAPGGGGAASPGYGCALHVQATHIGGHVSRPGQAGHFFPTNVRGTSCTRRARLALPEPAPWAQPGDHPLGGPGGDGQPIGVTVSASALHHVKEQCHGQSGTHQDGKLAGAGRVPDIDGRSRTRVRLRSQIGLPRPDRPRTGPVQRRLPARYGRPIAATRSRRSPGSP
jgi:hypothetical protein